MSLNSDKVIYLQGKTKIMIKWLAALIGYEIGRFPGAILGFLIGTFIDSYYGKRKVSGGFTSNYRRPQQVNLGDFELNLLSLSSLVIKADGQASQTELDYVRMYFARTYGKERANATFRTFNEVVKNRKVEAPRICNYLRARTSYEMRLQVLHFLFGVAHADGQVSSAEVNVLQEIAGYLGLNRYDFESIKAMFFKSADEAYKILEVDEKASEAEIKKAYRSMVKKYHPDKLNDMDEAYKKGAREKFDRVQEAYEKIRKERGF